MLERGYDEEQIITLQCFIIDCGTAPNEVLNEFMKLEDLTLSNKTDALNRVYRKLSEGTLLLFACYSKSYQIVLHTSNLVLVENVFK